MSNGRRRRRFRRRNSEVEDAEERPLGRVLQRRWQKTRTLVTNKLTWATEGGKNEVREGKIYENCRERGRGQGEFFRDGRPKMGKSTREARSRKAAEPIKCLSSVPLDDSRGRRKPTHPDIKLTGRVPDRTTPPGQDVDAPASSGRYARLDWTNDEGGAYSAQRIPAVRSTT